MNTNEPVRETLAGHGGAWDLVYDPVEDELRLDDDEQTLALLADAAVHLRPVADSTFAAALFLPAADLDLGWTLTYFPDTGMLMLLNPFGEPVGGLGDARVLIGTIRAALDAPKPLHDVG